MTYNYRACKIVMVQTLRYSNIVAYNSYTASKLEAGDSHGNYWIAGGVKIQEDEIHSFQDTSSSRPVPTPVRCYTRGGQVCARTIGGGRLEICTN